MTANPLSIVDANTAPAAPPGAQAVSLATAALAGLVFGAGLVLSGMTEQSKVLGFLDLASGAWDPSLALVMVGAIGVHGGLRWLLARHPRWAQRPRFADTYDEAPSSTLDRRLVGGAALFGMGWGLGGVCPGPALVAASSLAPTLLCFVAGLFLGFAVHAQTRRLG